MLTPYFHIKHPTGNGPFPAVNCFHASGGLFYPDGDNSQGTLDGADYFISLGYACILVDNYTGQIYTDDDLNKISEGRKFWGPEYAGYVLSAITEVRKLAFVDPNQLAIMGKSLGGGRGQGDRQVAPTGPKKIVGVIMAGFNVVETKRINATYDMPGTPAGNAIISNTLSETIPITCKSPNISPTTRKDGKKINQTRSIHPRHDNNIVGATCWSPV